MSREAPRRRGGGLGFGLVKSRCECPPQEQFTYQSEWLSRNPRCFTQQTVPSEREGLILVPCAISSIAGCRSDAKQYRDKCKDRQAVFCDTLSLLCMKAKNAWVIPACAFFNLLCNHEETCDKRYDEWLDFCNTCYDICLHNCEPDNGFKKRFKGIPPQLLRAWGIKL